MRITDTDRDAATARLREAFAEGRIDDSELSDRLELIYKAKTGSELSPAFSGLPVPVQPAPPAEPVPALLQSALPALSPFILACFICTAIWLITTRGYFWPIWVYLGCSVPVFGILVGVMQQRKR